LAEEGASVVLSRPGCAARSRAAQRRLREELWLAAWRCAPASPTRALRDRARPRLRRAIGAWCEREGVERGSGRRAARRSRGGAGARRAAVGVAARELGVADRVVALDAGEVAARCASPSSAAASSAGPRPCSRRASRSALRRRLAERGGWASSTRGCAVGRDGEGVETAAGARARRAGRPRAGGALASFGRCGALTVASSTSS
jgi:hypothetical protein